VNNPAGGLSTAQSSLARSGRTAIWPPPPAGARSARAAHNVGESLTSGLGRTPVLRPELGDDQWSEASANNCANERTTVLTGSTPRPTDPASSGRPQAKADARAHSQARDVAVREAAGVREWIVASRLAVGVTALAAVAALTTACTDREPARYPLSWPFASTSIWNMPIGTSADYVSADLPDVPGGDEWSPMPGLDAEYLLLDPDAPLTKLNYNGVGWDGGDRCKPGSDILATIPVPNDYTVPTNNHNNGAVFLLSDRRTILQSQPFTRCEAGGPATSLLTFPEQDLYGDGISGAHGGSRLSSLGGSLRLGELRPDQQGPRHALKLNVYARQAFYKCQTKDQCWTWPASKADSEAVGNYGVDNDNQNTGMRMGALLAIPISTNLGSLGLETEPASQLAWTLQNSGAYIVDETSAPGFDFSAETGPQGSFSRQFAADYGFTFAQRDMQRIVRALHARVTSAGVVFDPVFA
jgi:hypothetical protein